MKELMGLLVSFFLKVQLIQNMNAYCKSLHKTSAKLMSSSTVLSLIFYLPTSSKSMELNIKFSFIIYLKQNHQFFNNMSLWKHSTLFVFLSLFFIISIFTMSIFLWLYKWTTIICSYKRILSLKIFCKTKLQINSSFRKNSSISVK